MNDKFLIMETIDLLEKKEIEELEGKLDNESCPEVIEFYVTCKEFERKVKTRDESYF